MGKTKRKYNAECVRLAKQLKRPITNVIETLPREFKDEDFIAQFKVCYKYLWDDICSYYQTYKDMDSRRKKKGFSTYDFPYPNRFLLKAAYHKLKRARKDREQNTYVDDEEKRIAQTKELIGHSDKKVALRKKKSSSRQRPIQKVKPQYENYFEKEYFNSKRHHPEDVDTRMAVVQEAGKYKCQATIKFLHRVHASERNYHIKQEAFLKLQAFNVKISLTEKRKGKKRKGDAIIPSTFDTPCKLLEFIYKSQLETHKMYDLFLSHSSLDEEQLLQLKTKLNSLGINVYVDWMADKDSLKRELTNEDTAQVLIERQKQSKALMYVFTGNSLESKWTPWEIGYFHALKEKVCILFLEDVDYLPPFYSLYPKAEENEKGLSVIINEQHVSIQDWIKENSKQA